MSVAAGASAAYSCDALVVGGGPAGSTCAWQLLRAGLDVLVMDKQPFPRDKVCAGWITPAVIESLQLDVGAYARGRVMQPVTGFRTGIIGASTEVETRYPAPVSFGIRRCEFDDYLLRRSAARLRLGEPVRSIEREGRGWLVNGEIRTPLLIGAGGHFCPVARALGSQLGQSETVVAAKEIEVPVGAYPGERRGDDDTQVRFYFCPDLKGYGWCFRKGDFLNIGLGREDNHGLSAQVEQFCRWLQERGLIPAGLTGKFNGHAYLLYPASRRVPVSDAALLLGDAAGLAYPRSGEGIRAAVESALLAAGVVLDAAGDYRRVRLEPYAGRLVERFGNRNPAAASRSLLRPGLRSRVAARLLENPWFARHVVLDRWFLHARQRPLQPR